MENESSSMYRNSLTVKIESKKVTLGLFYSWFPGCFPIEDDSTDYPELEPFKKEEKLFLSIEEDKATASVDLSLQAYPALAKWWCEQHCFNYLNSIKRLISKRTFTGNTCYYVKDDDKSSDTLSNYSKYELIIKEGQDPTELELIINYSGRSTIHNQTVTELIKNYNIDSHLFKKVLCEQRIISFTKAKERGISNEALRPVLNYNLFNSLRIPINRKLQLDKLVHFVEQINRFKSILVDGGAFLKNGTLSTRWQVVDTDKIYTLKQQKKLLKFRGNVCHTNIMTGLKQSGPYKSAPHNHFIFFIIYRDPKAKQLLVNHLNNTKGFSQISDYSHLDLFYQNGWDLQINGEKPIPKQVETHISQLTLAHDTQYIAFYISPIQKQNALPEEYTIYHQVKGALLQRDIISQVLDEKKILTQQNINYWIANIGSSLIAKCGGVPWVVERKEQSNIILGIGAFKGKNQQKPYLASAFIFDNSGAFKEMHCWAAESIWMLQGELKIAVNTVLNREPQPSMLIIHYYKEINRKEMQLIEEILDDTDSRIPIVVIRINSTFNSQEIGFLSEAEKRLPLDGSYINIRNNEYLLYLNTREQMSQDARHAPMPLKISLQSNKINYVKDKKVIEAAMQQLYDFSLLHWRSIKQKRLPVTIAYPKYLAEIAPHLPNQIPPTGMDERLWFL